MFCDRLVTDQDRTFVAEKMTDLIKENFAEELSHTNTDPILFGDFRQVASPSGEEVRIYEDLGDYGELKVKHFFSIVN